MPGLDDKQHQVHITYRAQHRFVQRAIQCIGMRGLKTWRIHKNELSMTGVVYAGDAVAGGLRLARGDADFLTHQGIEQRGFTHVGFAHNGHRAAPLFGGGCV